VVAGASAAGATAAVALWHRRPDYSSLFHTRRGSTHAPSRRRQDRKYLIHRRKKRIGDHASSEACC